MTLRLQDGTFVHDFTEKLAFSKGIRKSTDLETIRSMIPGCVDVRQTTVQMDRSGVDYIATLRKGAELLIDAKSREKGCSRWWACGPELALEIYSVLPNGKYNIRQEDAKTGWTLCEKKNTDLILYTFDPSDTCDTFLFGFQHLRMAFRRNFHEWVPRFGVKIQDSGKWQSSCVFVPYRIVLEAVSELCVGKQVVKLLKG